MLDAIHIRPLGLVCAAENNPIVVFRLYAEYAAGSQYGVIDFGQPTVGTGQYEIMQYIGTAFGESRPDPPLTDLRGDKLRQVVGGRAKNQRQ